MERALDSNRLMLKKQHRLTEVTMQVVFAIEMEREHSWNLKVEERMITKLQQLTEEMKRAFGTMLERARETLLDQRCWMLTRWVMKKQVQTAENLILKPVMKKKCAFEVVLERASETQLNMRWWMLSP